MTSIEMFRLFFLCVCFFQISRLQNGAEVSREVHSLAKDELRHSLDYYMLFWPERKVGTSLSLGNKWEKVVTLIALLSHSCR